MPLGRDGFLVGSIPRTLTNRLIVVTILVLLAQLTLLLIPVTSGQSLQVDVWTNKGGIGVYNPDGGTYVIGEWIRICVNINMDVYRLRLYAVAPDGRVVVYFDSPRPAGTYCLEGIEVGPPGYQIVIAEAWVGDQTARDEVWYYTSGCPGHVLYLGVDIRIISDEDIELTGWFEPIGIRWGDFVNHCWNIYPGRDYYLSFLRNDLLNPMFGIRSSSTVGGGIDDSRQRVWLTLRVKFKDLSLSDHELKILRFRDPIKSAGRGFVDEVHLTSFKDIWKVSPQPTRVTARSAAWINKDAKSAPLEYEVYLYPIVSIRVRVEGIPPDVSVSVLINGVNVGSLRVGGYIEKTLVGQDHIVQVIPETLLYSQDTRYVCKNSTYRVRESKEIVFRYSAEYKVTISSTSGAGVTIDGVYYRFKELPFESWWKEGSIHQIIADEIGEQREVSKVERTASVFSRWSDGTTTREKRLIVSGPIRLVAEYVAKTQYYVRVESDYGKAEGGGWYDKGESISVWLENYKIEDQKVVIYVSEKERVVFLGWSGDLTSPNVKERLIVDSPKYIKANWKRQYYVSAVTARSHVDGGGWYNEGDTAKIILHETTVYAPDAKTRYVFKGWSGDYSGKEKEFTVTVNTPLTVVATWSTEYPVEISVVPEILTKMIPYEKVVWIESGERFYLDIKPEIQISSDTKYVFSRWEVDNKISYYREINEIVEKPLMISVRYEPWYYVVVKSDYGVASGSGWYKSGSTAEISVKPLTVGFLVVQVFDGWSLEGEIISRDSTLTFEVNRPLTLTAMWRTDYTGLIMLIAALGLIGGMGIIKYQGKPVYKIVKNYLKESFNIRASKNEVQEKLRKLEELYQRGEISEETFIRLREEMESKVQKDKETLK